MDEKTILLTEQEIQDLIDGNTVSVKGTLKGKPVTLSMTTTPETTGNMTCECGHNIMRHNRFMGEGKPFGCIDCDCEGFNEKHPKVIVICEETGELFDEVQ